MFESLEQVIDHYSMFQDGLPTVLTKSVPPADGQLLNRKRRGVSKFVCGHFIVLCNNHVVFSPIG